MICPEILEEVGYDLGKPLREKTITTASSIEKAPFYMVSRIDVLGFHVDHVEVASHRLPERVPADGLLGLNVLKQFNVYAEFRERVLRLSV